MSLMQSLPLLLCLLVFFPATAQAIDDEPSPAAATEQLTDAHALVEQARDHAERGEYFEARDLLRQAASLKPNDPDTAYLQAGVYHRLAKSDRALEIIDDALAQLDDQGQSKASSRLHSLRESIVDDARQSASLPTIASAPPLNDDRYPRRRWPDVALYGGAAITTGGLILATGLPLRSTIDRVESASHPDTYEADLDRISTAQTLSITAITTGLLMSSGALLYRWRSSPGSRPFLAGAQIRSSPAGLVLRF